MKLTAFQEAPDFMAAALPILEEEEAANNLMLGVALRIARDPSAYGSQPFMGVVRESGRTRLLALITPPHPLQLHAVDGPERSALEIVAGALRENAWPVPGVLAAEATAETFAAIWTELSGVPHRLATRLRVHELREVQHPAYSPGEFRTAREDETGLITEWMLRFHRDANVHTPMDEARAQERAETSIADRDMYLWDDGEPVSMALRARSTSHGACIGSVYTPPGFRGHGYATSCVARLSQRILDSGKDFACLYTDLANPTSNRIYRRIGYRPLRDLRNYLFEE